ncbi:MULTISPECIES: hypothetical protein [unclassified Saccharopolyspora]|uniref:hypothetical protein n=1 Tax=unclassified Saccharopolyspora TaxID=2646250 RepID=UPI001CD40081|nr:MULTISPECIES: hypothetical protein [unclassified Saccharopolyspora]MCA1190430.1 hypothetical protein [Saccharopolyspora sp. 6T]MCA1195757.1 hypothetical protein [Saccharopolyspora sp. 6V]MCA1229908.1 hypothetical protein [Saccharopolyspora sp. 6M]MCA1281891.1 hypothetical protein [Saccharopolyspora sp. 7B]
MRLNTFRRTAAIAALALAPALAIGAAAQATTGSAPSAESAATAQPTALDRSAVNEQARDIVAEQGVVRERGDVQTPDGEFVVFKANADGLLWVVGADTAVLKDGQPVGADELRDGDQVTVSGVPNGEHADATRVEIG